MKSEWIFRYKLEAKVELDQGPIIVEKHKKSLPVLDELLSRIRNDDGFDGMMTMP